MTNIDNLMIHTIFLFTYFLSLVFIHYCLNVFHSLLCFSNYFITVDMFSRYEDIFHILTAHHSLEFVAPSLVSTHTQCRIILESRQNMIQSNEGMPLQPIAQLSGRIFVERKVWHIHNQCQSVILPCSILCNISWQAD